MTRDELDDMIAKTMELSDTIDSVESNVYSTSERIDESEVTLRLYAMKKIADNIATAVRHLDEVWIAREAEEGA